MGHYLIHTHPTAAHASVRTPHYFIPNLQFHLPSHIKTDRCWVVACLSGSARRAAESGVWVKPGRALPGAHSQGRAPWDWTHSNIFLIFFFSKFLITQKITYQLAVPINESSLISLHPPPIFAPSIKYFGVCINTEEIQFVLWFHLLPLRNIFHVATAFIIITLKAA